MTRKSLVNLWRFIPMSILLHIIAFLSTSHTVCAYFASYLLTSFACIANLYTISHNNQMQSLCPDKNRNKKKNRRTTVLPWLYPSTYSSRYLWIFFSVFLPKTDIENTSRALGLSCFIFSLHLDSAPSSFLPPDIHSLSFRATSTVPFPLSSSYQSLSDESLLYLQSPLHHLQQRDST